MSEENKANYEQGLELALEVIEMAAIEDRKAIAMSILDNLCSPLAMHCPITQGLRDVATDFVNGGGSIPKWMEYEPLTA